MDIATIDDNIVESEQTFTVQLSTAQERVIIRNNTLVTINDNDGRRVQCGTL